MAASALLPALLPYTDEERRDLVGALTALSLDLQDLTAAAYLAHWSVRGPATWQLHLLFGELAAALSGHVDTVSEYLSELGAAPVGTAQQVAEGSRLDPYPTDLVDGMAHCKALTDRGKAFLTNARDAAEVCNDASAPDALDLVTQLMRDASKKLNFIADHLWSGKA